MITTRPHNGLFIILDAGRTFFQQIHTHMRDALARRKVYNATYHELSMLTDRDLRDLGIPRSHIRRLAKEAAYDC